VNLQGQEQVKCQFANCTAAECCNAVQWKYEPWSAWSRSQCRLDCGRKPMVESRAVACETVQNSTRVADEYCFGSKPETGRIKCKATHGCRDCASASCTMGYAPRFETPASCAGGENTCTLDECCYAAQWNISNDWSTECSKQCNLQFRFERRTVRCILPETGNATDETHCLGPKPKTVRSCPSTGPCPVCESIPCGDGLVSRSPGPDTCLTSPCTADECCERVSWRAGDWPPPDGVKCPTGCGRPALMEEREVTCATQDTNTTVDDALCSGVKPPTTRQRCSATADCESCGQADCRAGYSPKIPLPECGADGKPSCTVVECCHVAFWSYDAWDPAPVCPEVCGQSERHEEREVRCMELDSQKVVSDIYCWGSKPSTARVKCPATAPCAWCSSFECKTGSFAKMPAPKCQGAECTAEDCCSAVQWVYEDWPNKSQPCSTACGTAADEEVREVICREVSSSRQVSDNLCAGEKPATQHMHCQPTAACGLCDDYICKVGWVAKDPSRMPPVCSSSTCAPSECCHRANWVFFEWAIKVPPCDNQCGLPEQRERRSVSCQDMITGKVVSPFRCSAEKPPTSRVLCEATAACDSIM